ncbi:MAG: TolB family protein [Candidatus Sericytochromatia bacterium]
MKKSGILVTALLLCACNSPRFYRHFPSTYWTADNQLKIRFSHAGQSQYYQVKRDGTDLKTIAKTDYDRPDSTYESADGKYSFQVESFDTPVSEQSNGSGYKLSILDKQSKQSRALPDLLPHSAQFLGWSPDSRYFLMQVHPRITPDGTLLVEFWIVRASDLQILKFNAESFKISPPKQPSSAIWTQDSQLLFLLSNGNESETNYELWKSKADTPSPEQVTILMGQAGKHSLGIHALSPNNQQMILANGIRQLFFADLNTGKLKALSGGTGGEWSPDGSQFAFQAVAALDDPKYTGYADPNRPLADIMLYDIKQDQLKSLTQTPALHEEFPQWSPDGQSLAYTVNGTRNEASVFVIKPDGTNAIKVSRSITLIQDIPEP